MADAPEQEPPKPLDPVAEKKAREKEGEAIDLFGILHF